MATQQEHYEQLLADIYCWMMGGFASGLAKNVHFFEQHAIIPGGSGLAINLGAGCGFQSIPLARLGFCVTAIDTSEDLLRELQNNAAGLDIQTVRDDLINFDHYTTGRVELITCMTDTLLHLESKDKVRRLFEKVATSLETAGKCILTFRDLSAEVFGTDRFIPVQSDDSRIFTCFLEFEPETVKINDIVYRKEEGKWLLSKSDYRKLRLSREWVEHQLVEAGLSNVETKVDGGLVTIIATK